MKKTLTVLMMSFALGTFAQTTPPYKDTKLSPEQRADDLISRLTL